MNNRNDWYRNKDFFQQLPGTFIVTGDNVVEDTKTPYISHFVAFKSDYPIATTSAIEVTRRSNIDNPNIKTTVVLRSSSYSEKEIEELCLSTFNAEDIFIDKNFYGIKLNITNETNAKKLLNILTNLNQKYKREEFSSALLDDLRKIFFTDDRSQIHAVPFRDPTLSQKNWIYEWKVTQEWKNIESNPLLAYLTECDWHRTKFSKEKYEELLTKGHNTSEIGQTGINLLKFALDHDDEHVLKFALIYGANPFASIDDGYFYTYTPFDRALRGGKLHLAQLMLEHFQRNNDVDLTPLHANKELCQLLKKVEKPVVSFSDFKISSDNQRVTTSLRNSFGEVKLELCATSSLAKTELDELFPLYKKFFTASPVIKKNLEEFYLSEFLGKSKYVERITLNGELQGVNLYEIVTDEKYPDVIFFHISCIFMQEKLRGQGLTNPLIFTLGLAYQQLFPEKNIVCAYQAISYGSANLVKNLHFFPKYSGHLDQMASVLIPHIQRPLQKVHGPLLIQKPMTCFSEIEVENIVESKGKPIEITDLNKELFERMRDRTLTSNQDTHRGVLIMLAVSDELFQQYASLCIRMKLNPLEYIDCFATHFEKMTSGKNLTLQKLYLPKNASFFEKGLRETVNAEELLKAASCQTR